jgi:small subunit ribosomal protein S11
MLKLLLISKCAYTPKMAGVIPLVCTGHLRHISKTQTHNFAQLDAEMPLTKRPTQTAQSLLKVKPQHLTVSKTKHKSNKVKQRSRSKYTIKQKARYYLHKKNRFLNIGQLTRWYETFKMAQPEKFCLVTISKTKNNTHGSVSSLFGSAKSLWATSGGVYSNKINGRRKTRYVQRMVYKSIVDKILALGLQFLIVHCKGTFISKRFIFKTFSKNFKVLLIKDITGIAHNGCRPPKIRRV